jgi:hypothetical protein
MELHVGLESPAALAAEMGVDRGGGIHRDQFVPPACFRHCGDDAAGVLVLDLGNAFALQIVVHRNQIGEADCRVSIRARAF